MHPLATGFFQDQDFIRSCYIVAFICFIVGLQNLRTPVPHHRGGSLRPRLVVQLAQDAAHVDAGRSLGDDQRLDWRVGHA